MKKIFAIIIAAIMMFSISVTAFADGLDGPITSDAQNVEIDVTATINDLSGNDIYIYVNWGDMEFTYYKNDYNPNTGETTSYWLDAQAGHISVENWSNVGIDCTFSFAANEEVWSGGDLYFELNNTSDFIGAVTKDATWDDASWTLSLEAPSEGDFADPDDETSSYSMPTGVIDVTVNSEVAPTQDGSLGTITLFLSAHSN